MKLNNPPVIQTWIGFKFVPGQEKPPWNMDTAAGFLRRFEGQLPHLEAIIETTFQIQPYSDPRGLRRLRGEDRLDRARARNEDQSHWLQLADDHMVYNQNRAETYLGFETLRDEAISKMVDYIEFFRPGGLATVELHYVDLIEIPVPPDGKVDLEDYFRLRIEIPAKFGVVWHFSTQVFIRPEAGDSILEVKFESIKPEEGAGTYRFRLDWHFLCINIESWDRESVRGRLDEAHTCLLDYFRSSVTEKTWQLFQPSGEG